MVFMHIYRGDCSIFVIISTFLLQFYIINRNVMILMSSDWMGAQDGGPFSLSPMFLHSVIQGQSPVEQQ